MYRNRSVLGLVLLALGGVAALLRLPGLGHASLWWDECHTLSMAQFVGRAELPALLRAFARGLSTYFLLLVPWVTAATSEALLRMPSVLGGCLLVLALWWLGREVGGATVGWWSGVAGALSPFLVWHSREARWYSWTWLLVALSGACLFRAVRNGDWRWLGAFVALGLAASSTFWPAVTIPCTGLLWVLGTRRFRARFVDSWGRLGLGARTRTLVWVGCCAAALLTWGWLSLGRPVLREGVQGYHFSNVGGPSPYAVAYTGVAFATGYTLGPGPSEWHTLSLRSVTPLDLLLIALGVASLLVLLAVGVHTLWRERGSEVTGTVIGLAVLPPLVVVLACALTDHTYAPRYAGISYPFVLVLSVVSLETLRLKRVVGAVAVLLAALQMGALWNLHFSTRYEREDVRSAAAYVESRVRMGEAVLVFGGIDVPWRHYYNGVVAARIVYAARAGAWSRESVRSSLSGATAVWAVSGRLWDEPGSEELMAEVVAWGDETDRAGFAGGVEVLRYSPAGGSVP